MNFLPNLNRCDCLTRFFQAAFIAGVSVTLACCGGKEVSRNHDVPRQLFEKSVRMISAYIDSVDNAKDSVSLRTLVNNFNTKITTLNFEFPSDTDLELNEDENDSLIRMHTRLVRAIELRDSILSHSVDTVAHAEGKDSVSVSAPISVKNINAAND